MLLFGDAACGYLHVTMRTEHRRRTGDGWPLFLAALVNAKRDPHAPCWGCKLKLRDLALLGALNWIAFRFSEPQMGWGQFCHFFPIAKFSKSTCFWWQEMWQLRKKDESHAQSRSWRTSHQDVAILVIKNPRNNAILANIWKPSGKRGTFLFHVVSESKTNLISSTINYLLHICTSVFCHQWELRAFSLTKENNRLLW